MVRFASIIAAAGAAVMMPCGSVRAASDITIAAIATGRLYVVGTTERPHTAVTLDDKFHTESDDTGKFQYELVYHPARCIVSAAIDGKAYEAVVTNCSQQCQVVPSGGAVPSGGVVSSGGGMALPAAARAPLPVTAPPAGAAPGPAIPPAVRPAAPVRTGVVPRPVKPKPAPTQAAAPAPAIQPDGAAPQRPVQHAAPKARPVQPPRPVRKPRPPEMQAPEPAEAPIAD